MTPKESEEKEKFLTWLETAKWVLPEYWSIYECRMFYESEILKKKEQE